MTTSPPQQSIRRRDAACKSVVRLDLAFERASMRRCAAISTGSGAVVAWQVPRGALGAVW